MSVKHHNSSFYSLQHHDYSDHANNRFKFDSISNHKYNYNPSDLDKRITNVKNVPIYKGLTDGNGLTNGNGLTDGNGLTNGNGLTINIFSRNHLKRPIYHRKARVSQLAARNRRKKYIEAIIAILLILLPLSIYFIGSDTQIQLIQIDGKFQDWKSEEVTQYFDTDTEPVQNPYTNLVECRTLTHDNVLEFYVQTELDIFGGESQIKNQDDNPNLYKLDIFIDHDLNPSTGFQIQGFGADELIELQGQNGIITHTNSYYFDTNRNNLDWNGWKINSNVNVAKERLRLEGRHYLSQAQSSSGPYNGPHPNSKNPGQLGIIIQMMDSERTIDLTEPFITGSEAWHVLELSDLSPDSIATDVNVIPLIGLDFNPFTHNQQSSPGPMELHSFSWRYQVSEQFSKFELQNYGRMKIYIDENFNYMLDTADFEVTNCNIDTYGSELTIDFSPPIEIPYETTKQYLLCFEPYKIPTTNERLLLNINLKSIQIRGNAPVIPSISTDSNHELVMYLGATPNEITMDGIFSDWQNYDQMMSDLDIPKLPEYNQDRDINEVSINIDPKSGAFSCYLSVAGKLLKGTNTPPIFKSDILTVSKSSQPVKQNTSSDQIKTIDDSEKLTELPKEILGTDKVSIFIDADQQVSTGYNPKWLSLGAEYLIEITGHQGLINQQTLYEYQSISSNTWSWGEIAEIPTYKDYNQLETQVDWKEWDFPLLNDLDVSVIISDWSELRSDTTSLSVIISQNLEEDQNPTIYTKDMGLGYGFEESNLLDNVDEHNASQPLDLELTRGSTISSVANLDSILDSPNQRKLVRDSSGYWYAIWHENNEVLAKRSNNTAGTLWSGLPVVLAGSATSVINGANQNAIYPSVDIYREPVISNNALHLVWTRVIGNRHTICYSKCTDLTDNTTFTDPNSWRNSTGVAGFDIIEDNINWSFAPNEGFTSIAVDRFNQPHVVWQHWYTSDPFYVIKYTMCNNSNGWNNSSPAPIVISPAPYADHKFPSIDITPNGDLHVAYRNLTPSPRIINYRQCWDSSQSMNLAYWGNAAGTSYEEDVVISNSSDMMFPSIACDTEGRVWIVTYEDTTAYDIWFDMEDFDDTTYWPGPFRIANAGQLENPTIGYDDSGTVYCVWRRYKAIDDASICLSMNASGNWSAPVEVVVGDDNIYPQIPKNISYGQDNVNIIYKNETNDDLIFLSIPELSSFAQIIGLVLLFQVLIMIPNRRKWFGEKK